MYVGRFIVAITAVTAATASAQQQRADTVARAQPPAMLVDSGAPLVLTRQQAVDSALAYNPTLTAAREQIAQARARVTQAVAIPDPSLSAGIVGQSGALSPHTANEHDYSLGLTVPFPDRLRLRGKVASADVRSAELSYQQLRQQIASQTSQTYDSLLVALRHLDDFQQARQLSQDFLTRTQARFEGGTSPRLDGRKYIVVFPSGRCCFENTATHARDCTLAHDGDPAWTSMCNEGSFYVNASGPHAGDAPAYEDGLLDLIHYVDANYRTLPAADVTER